MACFHCQLKQTANHTRCHHGTWTMQGRGRGATAPGYHLTPRHGWNSIVMQESHTGNKAKWKGQALPQPCKIK